MLFTITSPSHGVKYHQGIYIVYINLQHKTIINFTLQITSCTTVDELRAVCSQHFSELHDSGYSKASSSLVVNDKQSIIHFLSLQQVLFVCKAEIYQFGEGYLQALGTLDTMRKYPELFFVQSVHFGLTAGKLNYVANILYM